MTSRQPPKPRGRVQDRPSKDLLLKLLATHGACTVRQLSNMTGMTPRCVRAHMETLVYRDEARRVPKSSPVQYTVEPIESFAQAPAQDDEPVVHKVTPAGLWKIDHPTACRSVFEMGAA